MSGPSSSRANLTVVGGTYLEWCQSPEWNEIWGSGLRAAAAISSREAAIEFHTTIGTDDFPALQSLVASFGVAVQAVKTVGSCEFHYRHPLALPRLFAPEQAESTPIEVKAENALVFGMLEGNAIVHADRVVYDPQSPCQPQSFRANGSSARHLAVILNREEADRLTGESDVDRAATQLLNGEHAEVVIIKCGPQGARVYSKDGVRFIPAYRTSRTFLIGSGDIFSAEFAYRWLVENADPVDAAHAASRATAYYCSRPALPLPYDPASIFEAIVAPEKQRSVYLAGPFFNMQQVWMVEEAREHLTNQGLRVFSPYHDVGLGTGKAVAVADIEGLRNCDTVFALLDGYDPGTVFEVGFARALGKPVTAFISAHDDTHFTMFSGTDCTVFHDFASAIYWATWN